MTINKKSLLESLKNCMPGVDSGNTVLQGSDTFVFHDGRIFSYNDNISVSVPIEQSGLMGETVEGAVKANEFFKILSKLPNDEINFAVTEKSWLLKSGKAKAELSLIDFDYESRLKGIEPSEDWKEIKDDFIFAIGSCKMDNNKSPLSGVFVSGKEVISTDGYQINKFTMPDTELPTFWITDNCVNELLKIKNFTHMQLQGNWVHFKSGEDVIFSIKVLNKDNFPYEKVLKVLDNCNTENSLNATFPEQLFEAIDRATAFSMDISGHNSIRLVLSPKDIHVSAERTSGKYEEKVSWKEGTMNKEFEPITVYVDSLMMSYMAQKTLEFYLLISSSNIPPRLLFVSENSKHLLSTFTKD